MCIHVSLSPIPLSNSSNYSFLLVDKLVHKFQIFKQKFHCRQRPKLLFDDVATIGFM